MNHQGRLFVLAVLALPWALGAAGVNRAAADEPKAPTLHTR